MHKEEQRSGGKEHDARGNHGSCHRPYVTSAVSIFDRAESVLLAIREPDGIDVHVQLSTTSHPALLLGRGNGSPGNAPFRNHDDPIYADGIKDLKVYLISDLGAGRRNCSGEPQFDRSALF